MDKVTSAANQAVDATSAAVDSAADSLSNRPAQAATTAAAAQAPAATTPAVDPSNLIADELAKLAKLRDSGVLTDDEFASQKAKLLG